MSSKPADDGSNSAGEEASAGGQPQPIDPDSGEDLSSLAFSAALPTIPAFGAAVREEPALERSVTSQAKADERALDEGLIDRALGGDSDAYGELVRRHQDRLRASLFRMTGSAEEAEDVAQEAFVQAYLKLDSFQRTSRFYTWVYRIAFNQAISKNRKRRPRVSLSAVQEAGGPEPVAQAACPSNPAVDKERAALLQEAIHELESDHREVIVLREFDDMDYQQIAEVLEVPIGTVRSRLFRARSQLRERLAGVLGEQNNED